MITRRYFLQQLSFAALSVGVGNHLFAQSSFNQNTVTIAIDPEPPVLLSFANTSGTSVTVSTKVVEGLLEYDHELNPLPQLATERSEEHTSELQSRGHLVCRLLHEKTKNSSQRQK